MKNVPTNLSVSLVALDNLKYIYKQNKADINNMEEVMEYAKDNFMFCLISEVGGSKEKYDELVKTLKRREG